MGIGRAGVVVALLTFVFSLSKGQPKVYKGKINQQYVLNSGSVIINKSTGKRITYREYDELLNKNPGRYKTVPVFDKYGKPTSFAVTRISGQYNESPDTGYDADLLPEVGEVLPPFVMEGLDGKTYDSDRLRGRYVLLGFWVKYEKPLFTLASTKVIMHFVEDNRRKGIDVVSLGTTLNSNEECREAIPNRNCGFIPVPESYGFNHRYKIGETPFFILLDKNGVVKAMAPHTEFERISSLQLR